MDIVEEEKWWLFNLDNVFFSPSFDRHWSERVIFRKVPRQVRAMEWNVLVLRYWHWPTSFCCVDQRFVVARSSSWVNCDLLGFWHSWPPLINPWLFSLFFIWIEDWDIDKIVWILSDRLLHWKKLFPVLFIRTYFPFKNRRQKIIEWDIFWRLTEAEEDVKLLASFLLSLKSWLIVIRTMNISVFAFALP